MAEQESLIASLLNSFWPDFCLIA